MGGGVCGAEAPVGCESPNAMAKVFVWVVMRTRISGEIYTVAEQFEPEQPWFMQHSSWSDWLPQPACRMSPAVSIDAMQHSPTASVVSDNTGHGPITIVMTSSRFSQERVYVHCMNEAVNIQPMFLIRHNGW